MNNSIEINQSFRILSKVLLPKNNFEGDEMFSKVNFNYGCLKCKNINNVEIEPFKTGYPLADLYEKNKLIDR